MRSKIGFGSIIKVFFFFFVNNVLSLTSFFIKIAILTKTVTSKLLGAKTGNKEILCKSRDVFTVKSEFSNTRR